MDEFFRARLQCSATHMCRLGARALAEMLAEVAQRTGQPAAVLETLDVYGRIAPAMLAAVGADKFPPTLHLVPR